MAKTMVSIKPVRNMKKIIYALILSLAVVSGLVFANVEMKKEACKKPTSKPMTAAQKEAALKKWEATPDGIMYKKWKTSPEGKKIYAGEAKIRKSIKEFTPMEAIITSLSLPQGSRLGFGVMVKINGEDYILSFGIEEAGKNEFQHLHSLKAYDKIIIKSHNVSHAPKYAYPIISGDYVAKDGRIIYKRLPRKDGC